MSGKNTNYYVYCLLDSTKRVRYENPNLDFCFIYEPFYVGKGKKRRFRAHFMPSSLRIDTFKNNKIKKILESGSEVLSEVLVRDLTEDEAYTQEQLIITNIGRRDMNTGPLTNLSDGGYGSKNCQIYCTRKRVYKYSLEGELLAEYDSVKHAAAENGLGITNISSCCKKKANTCGGYFWSFRADEKIFIKNKKNRQIRQYDMEGNLVKCWDSVNDASIGSGILQSAISRICKGELISKNGFYFRYESDLFPIKSKRKTNRAVLKVDSGGVIEYPSVKETARSLGLVCKSVIFRCGSKYLYDDLYLIYKDEYEKGVRKEPKKKGNGERQVIKFDDNGVELCRFESVSQTASVEGISRSHLTRNLNKNKIKGYYYATICT
jgi:hypothetical protein